MVEESAAAGVPKSFWWISGLLFLWNIAGVANYLMAVTMSPEAIAALDPVEQEFMLNAPAWVTGAFAIAVFGATLGCIFLLMRKAWATPVFIVALIAVVVQFSYTTFMTDLVQARGWTSLILPVVIALIGAFEIWYAKNATNKGWLA